MWATLRASDAPGLITFLTEVLGFEVAVVYQEGDQVDHAQLNWPLGGGVMLGSMGTDPDDPWHFVPGSFCAYVVTDDTDSLFERALAGGAEIVRAPYDTDYGSRDFACRDPEGNLWSFGTYRGA